MTQPHEVITDGHTTRDAAFALGTARKKAAEAIRVDPNIGCIRRLIPEGEALNTKYPFLFVKVSTGERGILFLGARVDSKTGYRI